MAAILRALCKRAPLGCGKVIRNSAGALYCHTAVKGSRMQTNAPNHAVSSDLDSAQRAVGFSAHKDCVVVDWKAQNAWSKFHYLWLRDNCSCPHCFRTETNQRLQDTLQIPLDARPSHVEVTEQKMCIRWEDGHVSDYPLSWLIENSYEHEGIGETPERPTELWRKEIASSPPEVEYLKVMESDRELLKWLTNMEKYGFCFVRGMPVTAEATHKLLGDKIGTIIDIGGFGQFWSFPSESVKMIYDRSNTKEDLDPHTDGVYTYEAPGLQALHCLHHSGTGGKSILVDGFKLAEEIRKNNPEHFEILTSIPFTYHYSNSEHKYLNATQSIVLDPTTGEVIRLHFNNSRRLPLSSSDFKSLLQLPLSTTSGSVSPIKKMYAALQTFIGTTRSESLQYRFQLEPGNLLTFDNHRMMHARTTFTGQRQMCGCYINKNEWVGKLQMLREKYSE